MSTPGLSGFHEKIVAEVPQLRRGTVWCYSCGKSQQVNSANCLRSGWPTCCGQTMSIDSPGEREALCTTQKVEKDGLLLSAKLINFDESFRPTQAGRIWDAVREGHLLIEKLKAEGSR